MMMSRSNLFLSIDAVDMASMGAQMPLMIGYGNQNQTPQMGNTPMMGGGYGGGAPQYYGGSQNGF